MYISFFCASFVHSIDSSLLQVSLGQTQGAPSTHRKLFYIKNLSRYLNPYFLCRGESILGQVFTATWSVCQQECEEQLQHENFNFKLRVLLLEERVCKALGRSDGADIIKNWMWRMKCWRNPGSPALQLPGSCNYLIHLSKTEVDELQAKIDQLVNQATEYT